MNRALILAAAVTAAAWAAAALPAWASLALPGDLDGDARLSFQEYKAGRRALLLSADRDGDGRISPAEWLAGETTIRRKLALAGFPDRDIDLGTGGFARMDTNHNGYIDGDEIDAYIKKRFDSIDANHDGFLTRKEFEAGLKAGGRY